MSDERDRCPSCGLLYTQHLGLVGTCAAKLEYRARMARARAALLMIWPKGDACEHIHAREAFKELAP